MLANPLEEVYRSVTETPTPVQTPQPWRKNPHRTLLDTKMPLCITDGTGVQKDQWVGDVAQYRNVLVTIFNCKSDSHHYIIAVNEEGGKVISYIDPDPNVDSNGCTEVGVDPFGNPLPGKKFSLKVCSPNKETITSVTIKSIFS